MGNFRHFMMINVYFKSILSVFIRAYDFT